MDLGIALIICALILTCWIWGPLLLLVLLIPAATVQSIMDWQHERAMNRAMRDAEAAIYKAMQEAVERKLKEGK
jgi:hypothetical protein